VKTYKNYKLFSLLYFSFSYLNIRLSDILGWNQCLHRNKKKLESRKPNQQKLEKLKSLKRREEKSADVAKVHVAKVDVAKVDVAEVDD
jgi:hypothetical protein